METAKATFAGGCFWLGESTYRCFMATKYI